MKKLFSLLVIVFLNACAGSGIGEPVEAINLICESQEIDVLIFNSGVMLSGGAGFEFLQKIESSGGARYENKYYSIVNENGKWFVYKTEIIQMEYKAGDNAIPCRLNRNYDQKAMMKMYKDIPCLQEKCN